TLLRVNFFAGSPTVKYRGFFHDDEDILPRPFDYRGYPLYIGNVPLEWYKRFFETALRLRMNMVAPYTRVHRRFEVQKLASDWGLFYTSHHYDVLLSNPFGFHHFNLAEKRGVTGVWDWLSNRSNMLKYWRAGVEENGSLNCLWPVGLRGTDDYAYPFPSGMSTEEQNRIFREVIAAQIEMTRELTPKSQGPPVFTFTLYGEMLDKYLGQGGKFEMPENVILIWPDDNDGRMRSLPRGKNQWRHGVYYHLAYYGPVTKQSMHVVPPARIANEFKKITESGATEFALVNVSELREFVRGARMIAEICWDAKTALRDTPPLTISTSVLPAVPTALKQPPPPDMPSPSADRYVRWFSQEYFGAAAADDAAEAYRLYDQVLNRSDVQWYAADRVVGALNSLVKKFAGQRFAPARAETIPKLTDLDARCARALAPAERAASRMDRAERQFFFENCELPLRILQRQTRAALLLLQAMDEPDSAKAWSLCENAMPPLEKLETELARAERPPFERWYGETFVRKADSGLDLHRPYKALRAFLSSGGKLAPERQPSGKQNLEPFLPVVESYQEAH
ncbi:MAG TPA: glycosyl hydrolase 115 family protein, partial [Verrucomicrobiae bacterium]|nr:glycosyl hydrolase 115 family protein [Verrucomicrobiae bacterium]